MSENLVANEDLYIKYTNIVGPSDLDNTGDVQITNIGITAIKASKCKSNNKQNIVFPISYVWNTNCPFTSVLYNFVSGGGVLVDKTSSNKCDSIFIHKKGDKGLCVGSWTLKATPHTPMACNCNVEISQSGQEKAQAT